MSLRLQQPVPPVPDDTARIARAAFPRGNPYLLLRDRLGPVFDDAGFADLYPRRGQPAYTPWRLALVTLLQFREGLSDRQAAEAVRKRSDTVGEIGSIVRGPGVGWFSCWEIVHVALPAAASPTRARRHRPHRPRRVPPRQPLPSPA